MDFWGSGLMLGAALLVFGAGFVIGRKPTPASGKSTPDSGLEPPAPANSAQATAEAIALAKALYEGYERSAHPKDLLGMKDFAKGVQTLVNSSLPNGDLLHLSLNENAVLACMALEALGQRGADPETVERVISQCHQLYPWPLYYALRTADNHPNAVLAPFLLQLQSWWPENWAVTQFVRSFVESRMKQEEHTEPSSINVFGKALANLEAERLDELEQLLGRLAIDELAPYQTALKTHREVTIDFDFLKGIGRIWQASELSARSAAVIVHDQLAEPLRILEGALGQHPPRSVLVVGEVGVGKTTLIQAAGEWMGANGWTVFEARASDVVAGQSYMGELEAQLRTLFKNLRAEKRVLWVVPDFHEMLAAGQHRYNRSGVLDAVTPLLDSAQLVVLGETEPEAFERLIQARPQIQRLTTVLRLEPVNEGSTLALAQTWAERTEAELDPRVVPQVYQLAKQYLGESNSPGNVLTLLKLAQARAAERSQGLDFDVAVDTVSELTGLPRTVIDDREGLDLASIKSRFSARVIGQPEPVDCLCERIAMIKSGLTDPQRPLAVLFFVGPTGTGKTELAKALAEFIFGSPQRMIRLDMSEFKTAESLDRILGDSNEGGGQARSLVNSVRRQPFSVVLLDEFEKAHSNIWDLFLQVFDDGRLTDRLGNTTDFRHCIIILTSNLGAAASRGTSIGFMHGEKSVSTTQIQRALEEVFRPEFLNRLDRVLTFHPLGRTVMRDILTKELRDVLQRRGFRNREWAVEWDESAIDFLLEAGFTADLGARPLKRAIERHLLAPLAMTIVANRFPEGDQFLFLRSDGERLIADFVDPDAPPEAATTAATASDSSMDPASKPALVNVVADATGDPQEIALLANQLADTQDNMGALRWTQRKQTHLEATQAPDFWASQPRFSVLHQIELMDRMESGLRHAQSLLARIERTQRGRPGQVGANLTLVQKLAQQLYLLDCAYQSWEADEASDAYLKIEFVENDRDDAHRTREFSGRLRHMYGQWASKRRMRLEALGHGALAGGAGERSVYSVNGFGAYRILRPETGLHVLEYPGENHTTERSRVHVQVSGQLNGPSLSSGKSEAKPKDALEIAIQCLEENHYRPAVVRRYRELPSPLVRDSVRGWRTGRIHRVFDGDFDVLS